MDKELKYFERVLVNALSSLNEVCEEGRIPRDDAYVFSLTSIVDNLNPNSTVPTQGSNIVVNRYARGQGGTLSAPGTDHVRGGSHAFRHWLYADGI